MISTPGFIKFFWPKDNVQTKYQSIYNIPIINIHKQVINLDPLKDSQFILIHIKDTHQDQSIVQTIIGRAKVPVYILPDQNSRQTFEDIKKVYPSALGKMITNGQKTHPFMKFLKRSCFQLYDYDMYGSKKALPLGVFVKDEKDRILYYSGDSLTNFISKDLK